MSKPSRLVSLAAGAIVLVVSTVLSLFAGELAVRLIEPQQLVVMRPDLWVPRDSVGWWNAANSRTTINTGERTATIMTDAEGYRIGASGRIEGDQTVLLLGDSFMKALQVDYEQSLAGRLEAELPAVTGRRVAVRAGGVDGWDPDQYLTFARMALAAESADLVLVSLYLRNDLIDRRQVTRPPRTPQVRARFAIPLSVRPAAWKDGVLRPLNDRLERSSHLYVLLKNRSAMILMRAGLTGADFPFEIQRRAQGSGAWDTTAAIAADIADAARARGARTLFVLIPSSYQVHRDEFERFASGFELDTTEVDLDQPNRLLGAKLAAHGLTVVDPLDSLRAAAARGDRMFGRVDPHLSPEGHAVIARLVLPQAARMLDRGAGSASVTMAIGSGTRSAALAQALSAPTPGDAPRR